MQGNGSVVLATSSAITGSSTTPGLWNGAKGVLVVEAETYPGELNLQIRGLNAGWIRMNTSNIAADAVISFDLPAGEYRMNVGSGSVAGLSAVLLPVR